MAAPYEKPLPVPDPQSQPFWEACRRHELIVQRCRTCDNTQFYPRVLCTRCRGTDLGWVPASGRGLVHSFTVIRRAPSASFKPDLPYVLALVELEEGVRMMTNIVGCTVDEVRIEMPVEVVFDDVSEAISLPKFRPAAKTGGLP
jgi:uncharacterized OB-fold protein